MNVQLKLGMRRLRALFSPIDSLIDCLIGLTPRFHSTITSRRMKHISPTYAHTTPAHHCSPLVTQNATYHTHRLVTRSTKYAIYTAHPTLDSFAAARPRGEPVWKSIANDVAAHKRYKKRKGITVSDADAYSHLRHIALKRKHTSAPTATPTESPLVRPVAATATLPSSIQSSHLVVIVAAAAPPSDDTTDVATRPLLTPPSSPSSNKIVVRPTTPRTPSTPATPTQPVLCMPKQTGRHRHSAVS